MAGFTWRSSRCASVLLVAACGGHAAQTSAKHSPRPGWSARVALAIDVHAQQPLDDFPVPIRITPDRIDPKRYAADGHDLRFTDASGVDLPFEIESISASRGALVWLRVPHFDGAGPTRLTMYFDNPKAPYLAGSESRTVWRAGFAGVFHCIEDGVDSSPLEDATAVTGTNPAEGVFGAAFYFGTKKVDAVTATIPKLAGDATLCAWVRTDGIEGSARIAGAPGFALDRERGGIRCNQTLAANALAVDAWRYACCVHHAGIDMVFVDGVPSSKPSHSPGAGSTAFEVGGTHGDLPAKRFAGALDEVRISSVARDPAWLAAEVATRGDVVAFGAIENL